LTPGLERPAFGAVGGVAGLDFQTVGSPSQYGRVMVFGHANQTVLTVFEDKTSRSGAVVTTNATYALSRDGVLALNPGRGATSLWRYHIVASKPVSVAYAHDMQTPNGSQSYPYGRVVPAEPASPQATPLAAEFR